jgi:hypothetical protein
MTPRLLELATRHGALKARIDAQRLLLARHAAPLENALAVGDKALDGVDWIKHHPAEVGLAVAVVVLTGPKRAWRWTKRGIFVWRGWQSLKKSLVKLS